MELNYSMKLTDETKIAKAMGRDLNISFKHAVVICDKLRGMKVAKAMGLLEGVILLEKTIPFKKFVKGIGHKRGAPDGSAISKYPKKAAGEMLRILKNLEMNSEYKGLDSENLKIIHIQAQRGLTRRRKRPKGRYHIWETQLVNVQVVAKAL